MIRLRTLGQLELELPDAESGEGLLRASKRLATLIYLASRPGTLVRRDSLLPLFWPESDQAGARHALRNVLYEIRQDLGEDVILSRGTEDIGVDPQRLACDAVEFERALAAGEAERAVALYQGDFLTGFHLRDAAPDFEHWIEQRREALRRGHATALEQLAMAAQAAGDHVSAARWWRRLARHDPFSDRTAIRLMHALAAAGEKAEALRHAEAHARLLHDELGARPDPEVEAAADRIRRGEASAAPPPTTPDLVPGSEPKPRVARPDSVPVTRSRITGRRVAAVALAAVLAGVGAVLAGRAFRQLPEPLAASEIRRIAVLPFSNRTGDPGQDYFAAGITAQLVTRFAQIRELQVVSHSAVLGRGGDPLSVREIADELGVDAVVEGSVLRMADQVRVTAQLTEGETEAHLWAREYTRPFRDLLALEKEVAREIAREVEVTLSPEEEALLRTSPSIAPEAQEAFLRGVYLQRRHQEEGGSDAALVQSVQALTRAVELEPGWAEAHAELARAYHWLASSASSPGEAERKAELFRAARQAAETAIQLDETLAGGHAALAFVLHHYHRDWAGAEREYLRALELAPNDTYFRWGWALFELSAARYDRAIDDFRRALEQAPLSPILHSQLAHALVCAGRYDEARSIVNQFGEDDAGVQLYLARIALRQGARQRALDRFQRAVEISDSSALVLAALAHAYASVGREDDARELAADLEARDLWMPAVYAAIGERERALDQLELALERHSSAILSLRCYGAAAFTDLTTSYGLAGEPRMQELLRRIDFPG